MMKRVLILTLLLAMFTPLFAQNRAVVEGVVVDKSGSSVIGGIVSLSPKSGNPIYTTTRYDGYFEFSGVDYGNYILNVSFLGLDTLSQRASVFRERVNLGKLTMNEASQKIDDVVVSVNAIRTSQQGDTVIYNADAFKVAADASAENLLAKMPGLMVSGGTVEAQGEQIKRIYVDGKEFFGDDVTTAIKNLPSEVIQSIEVFNKLSDNAEMTGVDDGEGYKAINIVTNTGGLNKGQFGKVYGGYAIEDKYQVGFSGNYFTNKHRLSVIAMSNNINQQNFGTDDILGAIGTSSSGRGGGMRGGSSGGATSNFMVASQSGVASVNAVGLNYSGTLSPKLKMDLSYFFNHTINEKITDTNRQYITDTDVTRTYTSYGVTNTVNYNNKLSGRVEYKPNDYNSIMWRPQFTLQTNEAIYDGENANFQISDDITSPLNLVDRGNVNSRKGYNVSNYLSWRARFSKPGRSFSLSMSNNINQSDLTKLSFTDTYTYETDELGAVTSTTEEQTYQKIVDNGGGYTHSGMAMYSEPVNAAGTALMTMQYNVKYNYTDSDYLVYDVAADASIDPTLTAEQKAKAAIFSTIYDLDDSNQFNSGYLTHSVAPGFRYMNPEDKTSFNFNVAYQHATLANTQTIPSVIDYPSHEFDNFTYFFMLNKPFNATNTLRLMVRSSTTNPSATQLQDVLDISNPSSVTGGNSNLIPSYTNSLRASYVRSNLTKGRTFMLMASGGYTTDNIGTKTVMLLTEDASYTLPNGEALAQYGSYSAPVNLDAAKWNTSTSFNFGTPVNFLKSNLNLGGGITYSETPSVNDMRTTSEANEIHNMQNTTAFSYSASLGSNISEKVDFTISYKGAYNIADYDITTTAYSYNEYLTHSAAANLKVVMFWDLTLTGSATYTQYKGVTDDYKEDYTMVNLYLGKKLFKSKRGEIMFGVTDLLDQSEVFTRNVTSTYIENVKTNGLGRYWGILFTYQFRNFRGANSSQSGGQGQGERGRGEPGGFDRF